MMPVVLRFLGLATGELHMAKRTDLPMLLHHTLYNVLSLNSKFGFNEYLQVPPKFVNLDADN
jgi:hypothetical protein